MNNFTFKIFNHETIEETKLRFINKGVYENKIVTTSLPSVAVWSKTRKCLVGEKNRPNILGIITDKDGRKRLTCENNVFVSLQNRNELTEMDVREINDSEGIIITNATYGNLYFRYGFIPIN